MLRNFFKTGYRNIKKEKILSLVLIISLVVGLTSFSLIAIYLNFQYSFDSYHNDADKIYRVITKNIKDDKTYELSLGVYTDILNHNPGIQASTKLFLFEVPIDMNISGKKFRIESAYFTDSGFFKVFTHKFIAGSAEGVFTNPNDAIITKAYAMNFWGKTDVVGNIINCLGLNYCVKGVIDDVPYNSHFRFDILFPFSSAPKFFAGLGGNEFYTYLRIKRNADDSNVINVSKTECMAEYSKLEKYNFPKIDLFFQPLLDIHLNSEKFDFKIAEHGNSNQIKTLFIITICILVILIMNFINLLTVKFQKRLKEVGIRKILGSNNVSLLFQIISEPVIISLFSSILSIISVYLLMNPFAGFFNTDLTVYYNNFHYIAVSIIFISLLTGIISSAFPFYKLIKSDNPSYILSETKSVKRKKIMYASVIIQLAVVAGLLVMTLVTSSQIKYLRFKDLGFNKDRIICITNNGGIDFAVITAELEKINGIKAVTASNTLPGKAHSGMTLGKIGAPKGENYPVFENRIQKYFINVYGLNLIAGRDFIGTNEDEKDNIIINETAVNLLGFTPETIINQKVNHFNGIKTVIGVVKNFHFMSLHSKIEPLVLSNWSKNKNFYSCLINTDNYPVLLESMKGAFKSINPNYEFEYSFLIEDLNKVYMPDEKESNLIFYTAIICITLSLIGLISLTSYTIIRRTKEIGIRKVFGASTGKIMITLLKDYIILVIISNIIILPVVEMYISNWLNNYAFHITLSVWYFLGAFFLLLVLTIITVFYFTLKASVKNPIDTLKYE